MSSLGFSDVSDPASLVLLANPSRSGFGFGFGFDGLEDIEGISVEARALENAMNFPFGLKRACV